MTFSHPRSYGFGTLWVVSCVVIGVLFNGFRTVWLRRRDPTVKTNLLPVLGLRILFSRYNPLGGALDRLRIELGIDLKGAWAITVLRRSAEPMVVGFHCCWHGVPVH